MLLRETLAAAGMIPPAELVPGRWLRFPGIGKGRSNRSGWCRIISPTLAIYGDWSANLSAVWKDDTHRDDKETARQLEDARRREREFARAQRAKQEEVARDAQTLIRQAKFGVHPYLARKGFPGTSGLIYGTRLAIPMRDTCRYLEPVINVQLIAEDGTKRFMTGGRAGGAVYILGPRSSRHTVLCEGYATGLTVEAALKLLPGPNRVVVCFSAMNLERVAPLYPGAVIAADNDRSATGQHAAQATGLKWTMPYEVGTDFNDLHQRQGLMPVIEMMRALVCP